MLPRKHDCPIYKLQSVHVHWSEYQDLPLVSNSLNVSDLSFFCKSSFLHIYGTRSSINKRQ